MLSTLVLLIQVVGSALGLSAPAAAEKSYELAVLGGFGLTQVDGTSVHQDSWNYYRISDVWERTAIQAQSNNAPVLGGELRRFFGPRLGIGVVFGSWKSDIDTKGDFEFRYSWADGGGDSKSTSWTGGGSLQTQFLGVNGIACFGLGPFQGYAAAGPALVFHRLTLKSHFGGGVANYGETVDQHIDALKIPLEIDGETWSAVGFNLRLGINAMLGPRLGLTLECRYVICPAKTLQWNVIPGRYDGIFYENEIKDFVLTAEGARYVLDHQKLSAITVNPSSLQVLIGLRVRLF